MQYVIKLKHKRTGNSYYFKKFDGVDSEGRPRPVSSMTHYRDLSLRIKRFPSIEAACDVVRQIDQKKWNCLIRPASVITYFPSQRYQELLK